METTKWRKMHGNFLLDDAHTHRKSLLKSVQIAGGEAHLLVTWQDTSGRSNLIWTSSYLNLNLPFVFLQLGNRLVRMFLNTTDISYTDNDSTDRTTDGDYSNITTETSVSFNITDPDIPRLALKHVYFKAALIVNNYYGMSLVGIGLIWKTHWVCWLCCR